MTQFDPVEYKNVERQVYSMTASSYEQYGSASFEIFARPLLDSAGLKPGQHVLDVACGPGIPSLMAAGAVVPGGTVTGVDLAPGMVELASKKAEERGLKNVIFREADAEKLPFPDDSFDIVFCNHGLVHTTDRMKTLREMRRVLKKTSGILALSVWSTPDRALAIGVVAKIIRELWPAAAVPGAPMWFDFGPEGAFEKTLSDAGFQDIRTSRHTLPFDVESPEQYWEGIVGTSGRLQMLLKNIPDDIVSGIKTNVIKAAKGFRSGDGHVSIPCEEVIGVARK